MWYPDGGGLTTEERARREQVRLAAAETGYTNGQHRAQAMLEAGVRRTVVLQRRAGRQSRP